MRGFMKTAPAMGMTVLGLATCLAILFEARSKAQVKVVRLAQNPLVTVASSPSLGVCGHASGALGGR
jgi:hypothetical protein